MKADQPVACDPPQAPKSPPQAFLTAVFGHVTHVTKQRNHHQLQLTLIRYTRSKKKALHRKYILRVHIYGLLPFNVITAHYLFVLCNKVMDVCVNWILYYLSCCQFELNSNLPNICVVIYNKVMDVFVICGSYFFLFPFSVFSFVFCFFKYGNCFFCLTGPAPNLFSLPKPLGTGPPGPASSH